MSETEFRAWAEHQYRERVLYPAVTRRQRTIEEWRRIEPGERAMRWPRRWAGAVLLACGAALAALGQRVQGTAGEPVAPIR